MFSSFICRKTRIRQGKSKPASRKRRYDEDEEFDDYHSDDAERDYYDNHDDNPRGRKRQNRGEEMLTIEGDARSLLSARNRTRAPFDDDEAYSDEENVEDLPTTNAKRKMTKRMYADDIDEKIKTIRLVFLKIDSIEKALLRNTQPG